VVFHLFEQTGVWMAGLNACKLLKINSLIIISNEIFGAQGRAVVGWG
jgi:hypothetical protein